MNFADSNPFVRQAIQARLTKKIRDDVFHPIKTVDNRLFYIRSGGGQMRIETHVYPLEPGTVILFCAGTCYVWEIEDVEYYSINFDYTRHNAHITQTFHPIHAEVFDESGIIERQFFEDTPLLLRPIVVNRFPEIEKNMEQLVTEYLMHSEQSAAFTSGLLKATIVQILRRSTTIDHPQDSKATQTVRQVIEYIRANCAQDLSNSTIAAVFHFNPSYLNRCFKAHTGVTLHAFVRDYRISLAMEILRSQSLSIGEISKRCGFSNPYHFTKAFHQCTGVAPTIYRQEWESP